MKTILQTFVWVSLILFPFLRAYALHPAFQAPLYDHLVEVNKEWIHQAKAEGELAQPFSFENDRERIQTHLFGVIDILRERTTELRLSPQQKQRRLDMLNTLEQYAKKGNFPINTGHSYRIPYFIDAFGTPCAVGHLLIESGFKKVALRVQEEMNNAYVREIPYPELPAWAATYGFSVDELAWIQPGYPPPNFWRPIGSGNGANAPGSVIIEDTIHGGLIILGAFTSFNGVACHGAVRVDENGTTALDSFPLSGAKTAVFHQGKLWVGGLFPGPQGNINNLMIWNDTSWKASYAGFGDVNCLHVHDGKLFAGGDFHSALLDNLAVYDEANDYWAPFGSYLGYIQAMTTYKGDLVVGGKFSPFSSADVSYIARWDGSQWQRLASGGDTLDAPVRALFVDGQTLYAGGDMVDSGNVSYFGLASIEDAQVGWQYMLPNYNYFFFIPTMDSASAYIDDIQVHEDQIYLSGSFVAATGLIQGTSLGAYDTTSGGLIQPIGNFYTPVTDMLVGNKKIYATGPFTIPPGYVVETEVIANGLPEDPRFEALRIFPNPARDQVTMKWDFPTQGMQIELDVYDLSGKRIAVEYSTEAQSIRLQRGNLPAGVYPFVLRDGAQPLSRGRVIFR